MEGEIMEVHDYAKDSAKKIKQVRYVCRVIMRNGGEILVPNCVESTIFGGIADYMQIRHKSSKDNLEGGSGIAGALGKGSGGTGLTNSSDKNNARVGDRVYIAFINGDMSRPVIIGNAQHPNQIDEFGGEKHSDVKPQAIFQYNGMRFTVDKDGQFTLMHKGLPKIKSKPGAGVKSSAGGGLSAKSSTTASEPKSDAVEFPKQEEERTVLEFLKEGTFRVRDSEGQIIEIDRKKKRIHISNNNIKSTDKVGGTLPSVGDPGDEAAKADFFSIDGKKQTAIVSSRKDTQINSKGKRTDKTGGNHSHEILGNSEVKVKGDDKVTIGGNWEVTSSGSVTIKGSGATLKLSKGKVGIGGSSAELLDLFDKLLKQMDTLLSAMAQETHLSNLGYPSAPPLNAASYAAVQTQVAAIKTSLGTIKGGI
jgi:hypothetical protein